MSGIVGVLNTDFRPIDHSVLERMTESLHFRGPDGAMTWCGDGVGFGFARLAGLGRRGQVADSIFHDRDLSICGDIRLDDRGELIRRLAEAGCHDLLERTDSQLVLAAYGCWQEQCLPHVLGDFAFIIWDAARRRLFAAVDRFRVKRIYFSHSQSQLVVGNTLNSILEHPDVSDQLDPISVGDFLLFEHYRDVRATIYERVKRLPAAHFLVWEEGRLRIERYWSLPEESPFPLRRNGCVEQFDQMITSAVADRMEADSIAVLLSGGLDSSLVAAKMRDLRAEQHDQRPFVGYTAVFHSVIPDDEPHFSSLVARTLGIDQRWLSGDDYEIFGVDSGGFFHSPPEPIVADRWAWYVQQVRQISLECRCVLTGVEGDVPLIANLRHHWRQLFRSGRWGTFLKDAWWLLHAKHELPQIGFRSGLRNLIGRSPKVESRKFPAWIDAHFARATHLEDRWEQAQQRTAVQSPRGKANAHMQSASFATAFDAFDPEWTGSTVEFRHPLMDVRIVEFLLGLPAIPWCVDKNLFREILKQSLPKEVVSRPKTVLQQEPTLARLQRSKKTDDIPIVFTQTCQYYVNQRVLGELNKNSPLFDFQESLRPYSFNFWLQNRSR